MLRTDTVNVIQTTDFSLLLKLRESLLQAGFIDDANHNAKAINENAEICKDLGWPIYCDALFIYPDKVVTILTTAQIEADNQVIPMTMGNYDSVASNMFFI